MAVNSLDGTRPSADVRATKVNRDQSALTAIVRDGLLEGCGSLKSAAITMGMDQGQLTRELQDEGPRIGRLSKLEPHERAKVFDKLHQEFGSPADDPKAQLRREIRELRARADAAAALLERIA
jgi:hypothetical protein